VWAGIALLAALFWSILLRFPLIQSAPAHLDSDLAVDGLTLREALNGHWRWHYPGTPHIGIGALFLSWPQAYVWGANPATLVSGGTVAHLFLLAAVFALAWRVFGAIAAIGSLVPLTFVSTGLLWLSGRITGGHLLATAWSAMAWFFFYSAWARPGVASAIVLGSWCGLGVYLDSMFLLNLPALAAAGIWGFLSNRIGPRTRGAAEGAARRAGQFRPSFLHAAALTGAFLVGAAPRAIGQRMEPYNAYNDQFSWSVDPLLLSEHARILSLECLPRLIAGHRLPDLQSDPDPSLLGQGGPIQTGTAHREPPRLATRPLLVLSAGLFAGALSMLAAAACLGATSGSRVIGAGMMALALCVVIGFLINRNIFNSDNYRYLVLLLLPWSLGCGLLLRGTAALGTSARWFAGLLALALAVLFTDDALAWYRRMGWIDERAAPIRPRVHDPAERWLENHPEIDSIFGGYWDVYRLAFLCGRHLRGVPYPIFPNRFPEWSSRLPDGRPETLLARRSPEGQFFLAKARREGGREIYHEAGLSIVSWPWPKAGPSAAEGR
jgi:hypothetical protein